jgi:hypothetical protein
VRFACYTSMRLCDHFNSLAVAGSPEDTFTREWALFAIRNMCEISSEAQAAIRCVCLHKVSLCARDHWN